MSGRPVGLTVTGVSKKFARSTRQSMMYGVRDILGDMLSLSPSSTLRKGEFWALDDVSFDLSAGQALGIVGPNGSGKSTLLKVLNGIIAPDRGRVRVAGRVGALIEVGAGFHPALTGRENIFVNASILGMSRREIKRQFDAIVDFSGVEAFLDMPVKNYSSGMYVRLGFAVAVHCEPDILLVDEVLAVGDVAFQTKCFRHIERNILGKGVAACIVSHSIHTVTRLCGSAMLLEKGRTTYLGEAGGVVGPYYQSMFRSEAPAGSSHSGPPEERQGAGEVRVIRTELLRPDGSTPATFSPGESVVFCFHLNVLREMKPVPQVFLKVSDLSGTVVAYTVIPGEQRSRLTFRPGESVLRCRWDSLALMPGEYSVEVKLGGGNDLIQDHVPRAQVLRVSGGAEVYEATLGAGIAFHETAWSGDDSR